MGNHAVRHLTRLCAAIFFLASGSAQAVIINGEFSDPVDLAGWAPDGAVIGEPTGDFAQLETDGSFPRTLSQSFGIPATPSSLVFDFAFSTNTLGPVPGFPDSFAASVITDAGDFLDLLVVDRYGAIPDPSDGIESLIGALPIDVNLDPSVTIPGFLPFAGGTSFSGRVSLMLPSAVLGQGATLYFDLFDEFDGAASIAAVDNVAVARANAVPAPATLSLMLIGLAGVYSRKTLGQDPHD